MSHQVESIAWSNERPWHGLGVKVSPKLSPQQMLKKADLDWGVSKRPMFYSEDDSKGLPNLKVPDAYALVRDSDGSVLDVVGNQYTPVQNADAFKFFNDFVRAGKAKMDTAGSLRNGRMVWGLAALGNSFTLPGKDKVDGYLLVASPHEQGKSLRIQFTAVRVVCNNTLTMALNSSKIEQIFRHAHRRPFDDNMIEVAKEALGIANEQFEALAEQAEILSKKKVTAQQAEDYLKAVFQPVMKSKRTPKALNLATQALEYAPGQDLLSARGTAWGLLNAVTYTTDHLLARTADARLNKAWFGRTAALKQHALKLAGEL